MRRITWDQPKRLANLEKHSLDLADAELFDWDSAVIVDGHRDRYGKPRFKAIGQFFGHLAVVIYAELGSEAVAVISFRLADPAERTLFNDR